MSDLFSYDKACVLIQFKQGVRWERTSIWQAFSPKLHFCFLKPNQKKLTRTSLNVGQHNPAAGAQAKWILIKSLSEGQPTKKKTVHQNHMFQKDRTGALLQRVMTFHHHESFLKGKSAGGRATGSQTCRCAWLRSVTGLTGWERQRGISWRWWRCEEESRRSAGCDELSRRQIPALGTEKVRKVRRRTEQNRGLTVDPKQTLQRENSVAGRAFSFLGLQWHHHIINVPHDTINTVKTCQQSPAKVR